ncbi:D-3-phosphoglycerate dehydrogenase [Exophiala viscosa]|uniref:D-3-phosphoglycerate dehydrogenase n=1 Tax=Exophiala viscosa TaxID=2486360 RepID=UPI00219DA97E|nr:D-3-phosphoglycerate dehydrogenase [Exophiala viscosa]
MGKKPLVVALGDPKYAGEDFISDFKKDFDFEILLATNHQETLDSLPKLIAKSGPVSAFIVRMGTPPYEPFDEEMFSPLLPHCKIITSASAGFNEFDLDWMTANKIWFCNTRNAVAEATADMAIFLILAVLRDTTRAETGARSDTGAWKTGLVPCRDPTGLTLGIVGMGAIGKYTARKASVFNLKIKYHNRHQLPTEIEKEYNAEYVSNLHQLLSVSDIISISCPLNAETTNMISHAEFAAMKQGSFLVNTARGAVINEEALIEALESGKITRAGLDVFCNEPNINPYFKTSDKIVAQPHMGGLTDVAFMKSERECFENIRSLFKTGRPVAPVNEVKT